MSGIAGVYNLDGRPVDASAMEAMSKALAHRGPDGSGAWIDGSIGFAHLMLWTTPESLSEKQPLLGASGELVITADARIDNRDDLLRTLNLNGRPDISDSELILLAYSKWGERCPEKLMGDFAFAIWDRRRRTLFAARDRIGIKPFYYHPKDGREFVFASEISPIFKAVQSIRRPNRDAIRELLTTCEVAFDATLFEGIFRLPPASALTLRQGAIAIRKYWDPAEICRRREVKLEQDAEECRHLLRQAVQAHIRSAFPIGCLLSGGLDSSSITCLASKIISDKAQFTGFSMLFDQLPCDERDFIDEVTEDAAVAKVVTVVDNKKMGGRKGLDDCFRRHPDWPVQDLPSEAIWPLFDEAKARRTRVMLTGLGGDHVTQGSPYYLADLLTSFRLLALAKELKHYHFSRQIITKWMLAPLIPQRVTQLWLRLRGGDRAGSAVQVPRHGYPSAAAWHESRFIADPLTNVYLDGWWDALGVRGELEIRHPFFDARLMMFLLSLPAEEKLWRGVTKIILREAMKGIIPENIRLRRTKAEFSPLAEFALGSLRIDWPNSTLAHAGVIERHSTESRLDRISVVSPPLHSLHLWRLVGMEAWYDSNFSQQGGRP